MTPERLAEIRHVFGKGEVSYGPYAVSLGGEMARAGTELLAEVDRLKALAHSHLAEAHEWRRLAAERQERVDRLEAVVVGSVAKLRLEARVCDEAKWISERATAGCGGDPAVYDARSALATSTADALEAAIARPLDSPPAKR